MNKLIKKIKQLLAASEPSKIPVKPLPNLKELSSLYAKEGKLTNEVKKQIENLAKLKPEKRHPALVVFFKDKTDGPFVLGNHSVLASIKNKEKEILAKCITVSNIDECEICKVLFQLENQKNYDIETKKLFAHDLLLSGLSPQEISEILNLPLLYAQHESYQLNKAMTGDGPKRFGIHHSFVERWSKNRWDKTKKNRDPIRLLINRNDIKIDNLICFSQSGKSLLKHLYNLIKSARGFNPESFCLDSDLLPTYESIFEAFTFQVPLTKAEKNTLKKISKEKQSDYAPISCAFTPDEDGNALASVIIDLPCLASLRHGGKKVKAEIVEIESEETSPDFSASALNES